MKAILAVCLAVCTAGLPAQSGWQTLFNQQDLRGWTQRGGQADYRAEAGMIIGTTRAGTPNSFLCTASDYSDFILELEVWVDPSLNSGIQFRSQSLPGYRDGQVHGYQAEIDPSPRAYSGGIYDEGRRGWLCPLADHPEGRKAFRVGEWNRYRIEALGPLMTVWVNGIQTARLWDEATARGFIALQVHSIADAAQAGKEVRWRNIVLLPNPTPADLLPAAEAAPEVNLLPNQLSDFEMQRGWRLLWDGRTTRGWRSARGEAFPAEGWSVQDGMLTVQAGNGGESTNGGDIVTTETYTDFELSLEFRITEGANSGIKYFVQPDLNQTGGSAIGCEYQVLDDQRHPDAALGKLGNRTLGSLYDLIPAANLSVPGREKPFRGTDTWNLARIVVRGNLVEHWLNGFLIVRYERNTPAFRALVAESKYKIWPGFGDWPSGHILLQDHGNEVSFRSIKLRTL